MVPKVEAQGSPEVQRTPLGDFDGYEVGDEVRLTTRERPHQHDENLWWRVEAMNDLGLICAQGLYNERGTTWVVVSRRYGVSLLSVLEHRTHP